MEEEGGSFVCALRVSKAGAEAQNRNPNLFERNKVAFPLTPVCCVQPRPLEFWTWREHFRT